MIKKMRVARGKRATNKDPAPVTPTPEPPWVIEQGPTPEQDATNTERDERRRRLDDLHRLITG